MPLPEWNEDNPTKISFTLLNNEMDRPARSPLSLDDPELRLLAGKPSGKISIRDLYGKAAYGPGINMKNVQIRFSEFVRTNPNEPAKVGIVFYKNGRYYFLVNNCDSCTYTVTDLDTGRVYLENATKSDPQGANYGRWALWAITDDVNRMDRIPSYLGTKYNGWAWDDFEIKIETTGDTEVTSLPDYWYKSDFSYYHDVSNTTFGSSFIFFKDKSSGQALPFYKTFSVKIDSLT